MQVSISMGKHQNELWTSCWRETSELFYHQVCGYRDYGCIQNGLNIFMTCFILDIQRYDWKHFFYCYVNSVFQETVLHKLSNKIVLNGSSKNCRCNVIVASGFERQTKSKDIKTVSMLHLKIQSVVLSFLLASTEAHFVSNADFNETYT